MPAQHKIARVHATPLRILSDFSWLGVKRENAASACFVEVETDTGLKGHGITQHSDSAAVAVQINNVGPKLHGLDPLTNERIWHVLYWTLSGGAQVQYASWAISALDTAIWDIKGKALTTPIWKLLGGARDKVQAYATIGVPGADIEQFCEAARRLVAMGFKCLKTQVGRPGLDNLRGQKPMIEIVRNDARRIKALREALGDEIEIGIDAQCRLDLTHAMELVRLIEPYHVSFFEEPLVQNDVLLDGRHAPAHHGCRSTPARRGPRLPLSATCCLHNAIDVLQPNVSVTGGITNCVRDRRPRLRLQRADQRRRLFLAQYACAGRLRRRHHARISDRGGEDLRGDLHRHAAARQGLAYAAGHARPRIRPEAGDDQGIHGQVD